MRFPDRGSAALPSRSAPIPDVIPDDLAASALAESRACCCPARPVVRVVMPPSATRPHDTDLLLCGHHVRVSRAALRRAHATIRVLDGLSGDASAALLDWAADAP